MNSKRADLPCGCSYVKAGERWYQVVACPQHEMIIRAYSDVPVPTPRGSSLNQGPQR